MKMQNALTPSPSPILGEGDLNSLLPSWEKGGNKGDGHTRLPGPLHALLYINFAPYCRRPRAATGHTTSTSSPRTPTT